MEVISMKKKENRIFGAWILEKIFWQNDEETFFFTQRRRKECFISNQILKPLGCLWKKKIRKLEIFRATRRLSAEGSKGVYEEDKREKPYH